MKEGKKVINGSVYIPSHVLQHDLECRDESIKKIRIATETKRKMMNAGNTDKRTSIEIPDEYKVFGDFAYMVMESYVSGYSLVDDDGLVKCFYGNMGAPISLLIPNLFRGEIRDYGSTSGCSSLGRLINNTANGGSIEEKYLLFFIAQMRILCFEGFLSHFRQFREFPFGTPSAPLIAQHYGFDTQFLDVTDDLKVALFFACCKHIDNNKYRPITEQDIANLGRYGILYAGYNDLARIIGCQPFCRCHRQRGYYIDTAAYSNCWDYALPISGSLTKCCFERTVALSKKLYEDFEGGCMLFPKDSLYNYNKEIDCIRNITTFPFAVFDITFDTFTHYLQFQNNIQILDNELFAQMCNKDWFIARLKEREITFTENILIRSSEKELERINQAWDPNVYAHEEGIVYSPFIVFREKK